MKVVDGDAPPRDVEAVNGLLIGRHEDCGLILVDDHVSKQHAQLVLDGGQMVITDLGSNNGTIINGEVALGKGEQHPLQHGLRIQVGYVEITVSEASSRAGSKGEDGGAEASADANATVPGIVALDGSQLDPAKLEETVRAVSPFHSRVEDPPGPGRAPERRRSVEPARRASDGRARGSASATTRRASDSSEADFEEYHLRTIVAESGHLVGSEARLASMDARVIIVNEADLRIVPLDAPVFAVGRKESSNLHLTNRGVSLDHALIQFHAASNTFTIEDLGSANGTLLSGAPLARGAARELEPDSHVRFGTIEGVFMQSLDSEFHELFPSRHANAAKLLRSRGKLSAQTIKVAAADSRDEGISLGEALLLGQHVSPRDWCLAVKDARLAANLAALSDSRSKVKVGVALFIAAVALGLFAWWNSASNAPASASAGELDTELPAGER